MLDDFRQAGMATWARDSFNIFGKSWESWSVKAFSTLPGRLSGPAAFLGFTLVSICATCCTCVCTVSGLEHGRDWGRACVNAGRYYVVSKSVKKKVFSSSTDVALEGVAVLVCPLKLVSCCSPCHTYRGFLLEGFFWLSLLRQLSIANMFLLGLGINVIDPCVTVVGRCSLSMPSKTSRKKVH